ncbi:MAG: hypothetical protein QXD48_01300 [Candidatus Aenigmatarchaeota archaeon]
MELEKKAKMTKAIIDGFNYVLSNPKTYLRPLGKSMLADVLDKISLLEKNIIEEKNKKISSYEKLREIDALKWNILTVIPHLIRFLHNLYEDATIERQIEDVVNTFTKDLEGMQKLPYGEEEIKELMRIKKFFVDITEIFENYAHFVNFKQEVQKSEIEIGNKLKAIEHADRKLSREIFNDSRMLIEVINRMKKIELKEPEIEISKPTKEKNANLMVDFDPNPVYFNDQSKYWEYDIIINETNGVGLHIKELWAYYWGKWWDHSHYLGKWFPRYIPAGGYAKFSNQAGSNHNPGEDIIWKFIYDDDNGNKNLVSQATVYLR